MIKMQKRSLYLLTLIAFLFGSIDSLAKSTQFDIRGNYEFYKLAQKARKKGVETGTYKEEKKDGLYIINLSEGLLEGTSYHYFKDGTLAEKISFQEGLPNGKYFVYHENGQVKFELDFVYGKLEGFFKKSEINGNLLIVSQYSSNAKHGLDTVYKGNKISWQDSFSYGVYDGTYREFSDKGILLREINYRDGLPHGTLKVFYSNGKLKYLESYKEGLRDGIFEGYDYSEEIEPNHRLAFKSEWKDGKLIKKYL